jgi:Leucine-rich repeat (LRR) protein
MRYYLFFSFVLTSFCIPSEELVFLERFYETTNGDTWQWNGNGPHWNFTLLNPNPCSTNGQTWQGIKCNYSPIICFNEMIEKCLIIGIDLDMFQIKGYLPNNWTCFTHLIDLSLVLNHLTGKIPDLLPLSLKRIALSYNHLTGTIPQNIGDYTNLTIIKYDMNQLVGPIPSSLARLSSLVFLYLSGNSLNCSIPAFIGQLTSLGVLYIHDAQLTGPIPSSITSLSRLEYLVLDVNSLTGPIPTGIGSLTALFFFDLDLNYLSGPLPTSFGQLTNLETFTIDHNLITSTFPCEFSVLSSLTFIDVDYNYLTSLCSDLIFPPTLEVLDLSVNYFHSSFPASLISTLYQVELFDIHDNFFTSSLPENLQVMSSIYFFGANANLFSGSLPVCLGKMFGVNQLYLQHNHLTGTLDNLLLNWRRMSLENIDLSDNALTGEIPNQLFLLPLLNTIALTSNCFHGTIPGSICQDPVLSVVALDGLGAAPGCTFRDTYFSDEFSYGHRNSLHGEIPSCVWELPNLTSLSLSGNGLIGTIGPLPNSSTLVNLTLSHNHLSGTIPLSLQRHVFHILDLSYNKFTGDLTDFSSAPIHVPHFNISFRRNFSGTRRIVLEVNRFSGGFPRVSTPTSTVISRTLSLNILTGNIFGCEDFRSFGQYSSKSDMGKDIHAETYKCGNI